MATVSTRPALQHYTRLHAKLCIAQSLLETGSTPFTWVHLRMKVRREAPDVKASHFVGIIAYF
eukprot:4994989-Amphidinium_carterae.2